MNLELYLSLTSFEQYIFTIRVVFEKKKKLVFYLIQDLGKEFEKCLIPKPGCNYKIISFFGRKYTQRIFQGPKYDGIIMSRHKSGYPIGFTSTGPDISCIFLEIC